MITLSSPNDQERVRRAVREASTPEGSEDHKVGLGLLVGGQEVPLRRFESGEWGQSSVPITLDATLTGNLPARLHGAPVTLVAEVGGVTVLQVVGKKMALVAPRAAHTTDFLASSAGAYLAGDDPIKLGDYTEYPYDPPDGIVRDIARRLPYNQSRVRIQKIPGVRVSFAGDEDQPGFMAHEATGDVLSRLSSLDTVGYRYRDTALGGFEAWVPDPLGRLMEEADWPTYRAENLPNWSLERPTPPAARYHSVRVYALVDGEEAFDVVERIPYPPGTQLPRKGQTLDVPFEDASTDAHHNARKLAKRLARLEARKEAEGEMLLPAFDPLVEPENRFRVLEKHKDDDGYFSILWAMRVEKYRHRYARSGSSGGSSGGEGGLLSTSVGYTACVLEKDRIKAPTFIVPPSYTGVVPTPRKPYGAIGDDLYFDDGLSWVATSGDDLIFNNTNAGAATVSGDEIVVSE